jgi:hypothetical protein
LRSRQLEIASSPERDPRLVSSLCACRAPGNRRHSLTCKVVFCEAYRHSILLLSGVKGAMAASGILVPSLHTTAQLKLNIGRCTSGISIKKGSLFFPGMSTNKGFFATGEGSAPKSVNWSSTHRLARQSTLRSLVCKAVATSGIEEASGGMSISCLN